MPRLEKGIRRPNYVDAPSVTETSEAISPASEHQSTAEVASFWPYQTHQIALYYTRPAFPQQWASEWFSAGMSCTPGWSETEKIKADSVIQRLVQRAYSNSSKMRDPRERATKFYWAEELSELLQEEGLSGHVRSCEQVSDAQLSAKAEAGSTSESTNVGAGSSSWSMDRVREAPKEEADSGLVPYQSLRIPDRTHV